MKALDEYFLIVVFTLLLNRVHVFVNFMFNMSRETWQSKGKTVRYKTLTVILCVFKVVSNNSSDFTDGGLKLE